MLRLLLLLLLTTLGGFKASAQDTLLYWPKVELGMNITQTLAGFFNAGSQALPTDPYLFSLKFPGARSTFRTSVNARFRNREEIINFGQRLITERTFNFRAGLEWRRTLTPRFSFYYGFDAVLQYELERVDFNTGGGRIELGSNSTGFGAGPLMGLMFHLTPKILLSTESNLYGIASSGKEKDQTDPAIPPTEQRTRQFELIPTIPNSLYVFFRF
jgi:hypothetical protein